MKVGSVLSHRFEDFASLPDLRRRNGNGPPQPAPQSHIFRTGPAAPCTQHHHRVDVRGRPPPPLHDARRLWSTVPERVLISCHPYVGIDSAPSFAEPSARLSDLFGWLRQQRSMREPKGFAALDHVGAARCFAAVTQLTASLSAASLASRRARRRVVFAASACLSSSSGGRTLTWTCFTIINGSSAWWRGYYRRFNRALQLSTHTWHKPGTMRLFGRRHYRIIEIRGGEGDRRVSAGLIIVIAARWVGDGAFPKAVCTALCQGDTHLKFSFSNQRCC
jgi:hypothetical protein